MGLGFHLFGKPVIVLAAAVAGLGALRALPEYWPDHRTASDAIGRGDRVALERYLARGLDPDDRSQWRSFPSRTIGRATGWSIGSTPGLGPADRPLLDVALADCRGDLAALLLAAGADPRARGRDGGTPLWHAAACGDAGLLAGLLAAGAEVNAPEPDGGTALWEPSNLGWRRRPFEPAVIAALEGAGARMPAARHDRE